MSSTVLHEANKHRFIIDFTNEVDGDAVAELTYLLCDNKIDFNHTYVPFSLRGKGLAEELVKAGLAWAESNKYEMSASCPYVKPFLND